MKMEASALVKQLWSVLSSVLKSKSNAVKGKAADAMKCKVVMLGLMKNKKMFGAISHRVNAMFSAGHEEDGRSSSKDEQNALTVYRATTDVMPSTQQHCEREELDRFLSTHRIFDSDQSPGNNDQSMAIIPADLGRMSEVSLQLEEEIDSLADAFIKRFHSQMRLQKLHSFKRYQEMLDRSV
eukprot:Gb_28400 [translate_table: standard]